MANKFSKRHYEAVAKVIDNMINGNSSPDNIIDDFAEMFAEDNERFDRARFEKAAGRDNA